MSKNVNLIMKTISELIDEGELSNRKAKVLRVGVPQIAEIVSLDGSSTNSIKSSILYWYKFVEMQRVKQVKPKK